MLRVSSQKSAFFLLGLSPLFPFQVVPPAPLPYCWLMHVHVSLTLIRVFLFLLYLALCILFLSISTCVASSDSWLWHVDVLPDDNGVLSLEVHERCPCKLVGLSEECLESLQSSFSCKVSSSKGVSKKFNTI